MILARRKDTRRWQTLDRDSETSSAAQVNPTGAWDRIVVVNDDDVREYVVSQPKWEEVTADAGS